MFLLNNLSEDELISVQPITEEQRISKFEKKMEAKISSLENRTESLYNSHMKVAIRFCVHTVSINRINNQSEKAELYDKLCEIARLQNDETEYQKALTDFMSNKKLMAIANNEKIFSKGENIGEALKNRTGFLLEEEANTLKRKHDNASNNNNNKKNKINQDY